MVKGRAWSVLIFVGAAIVLWVLFSGGVSLPGEVPASGTRTGNDTTRFGSQPSSAPSGNPRSLWSVVDDAEKRRAAQERGAAMSATPSAAPGRRSIFNPNGAPAPASTPRPTRTTAAAPAYLSEPGRPSATITRTATVPADAAGNRAARQASNAAQSPLAAEGASSTSTTAAHLAADRSTPMSLATSTTMLTVLGALAAVAALALIVVLGGALLARR